MALARLRRVTDRTRLRESTEFVRGCLERFGLRGHQHLDVAPVYLGHVAQLRNVRRLMTTAQTKRAIVAAFRNMSPAAYRFHNLQDFFVPNPHGNDYVPKTVNFRRGPEIMFDVDHVVPKRWGGVDHPRNYAVMHRSLNYAFVDRLPECKMAYLEAHSQNALRRVYEFVTTIQRSSLMNQALAVHVRDEMPLW